MSGSSYGTIFKITTFGESHGSAIGGVVDGVPSNVSINVLEVQSELNRRRPGQSAVTSRRNESDQVQFLSGIFEGKTTGAPIGFIIPNENQRSADYEHLKSVFRPSHADFTYEKKYGIRDYRGGGRSSARETACRIVAGSIAKQILKNTGIQFSTYVDQVGNICLEDSSFYSLEDIESNSVRCPSSSLAIEMEAYILNIKKRGDTVGGCIRCIIKNVPVGLGEPVFDKLHAELGKAMLSINAVKGIEFGSGFSSARMLGTEHNDQFNPDGSTTSNHSGGIQGGISNGMPIVFRVAFKPVATIMREQSSINAEGEEIKLEGKGRHDSCVVPRAVPIVEAMTAIVILDFYLRNKTLCL